MFPSGDPTVICEQTTIDGAPDYTISFTIPSAGWVLINFMYVDDYLTIKINTPSYTYYFTRGMIGTITITDDTFTSVLLPVVEGTLSLTNADNSYTNISDDGSAIGIDLTYVTIYHYPCT